MPQSPSIVWFRIDLRLHDHAALRAAHKRGGPIVPVFIWSPDEEAPSAPGAASRVWLDRSLRALDTALRARGSRLIIAAGDSAASLDAVIAEVDAGAVFWSRRYEPQLVVRDARIRRRLVERGLIAESFNSALLFEPWTVETRDGRPYQVFTPFWKACLAKTEPAAALPVARSMRSPSRWPRSLTVDDLALCPAADWDDALINHWQPGEAGANAALRRFLADGLSGYAKQRDRPDQEGTSRLSPHLHFGEISPRRVWHAIAARSFKSASRQGDRALAPQDSERFLVELGWREFAHHLLYHYPDTPTQPLREQFKAFPWRRDQPALRAWQRGETGYPIVDAGMRQLWATGWMHNRVRMIVGSFLVKHLLLPWQQGAAWFWDTLVDADLANNTLGWQWIAGCGADAAPYFRIFNPVLQGRKFDPDGAYVRRWVPALRGVPTSHVHEPWAASPSEMARAGVTLGKEYPRPIIDHAEGRARALEALAAITHAPRISNTLRTSHVES